MSNTVITNYTDLNGPSSKADSSVVVIVNKDGSLSVDQNLLGTLMGTDGTQSAGISVVRVGHEGKPDDATDSEGEDDKIPHVTLTVDSYYDEPNSIIKYDSGAEMLQSLRIETRENSLVGFQNDHCYTPLTSPSQAPQRSESLGVYDEPIIEISHTPPPKPLPSSKKITILDQQIIPKGRKLLIQQPETPFILKGSDVINKPLQTKSKESKEIVKVIKDKEQSDESSESRSSSSESVPDRDSDSDYKDRNDQSPVKLRRPKPKARILQSSSLKTKRPDTKLTRFKLAQNTTKKEIKETKPKVNAINDSSIDIESLLPNTKIAVNTAEEPAKDKVVVKTAPKPPKKEKKTQSHQALLTDMTSLFSTPDVIRRVSTDNKTPGKNEKELLTSDKKTISKVQDESKVIDNTKSVLLSQQQAKQGIAKVNDAKHDKVAVEKDQPKGYDLIPHFDDASLAQIFQDTSSTHDTAMGGNSVKSQPAITTPIGMNSPALAGPLSPTLELLGGIQPEEEGLTEDLLMHVAQLVESSENLQEVIDKQVLGKVDTVPLKTPVQSPFQQAHATNLYTQTLSKTVPKSVQPRKEPIEIVRRDGRVITLPPIEAPATRSSKRKSQLETSLTAPEVPPPVVTAPPVVVTPEPIIQPAAISKQYVNKKLTTKKQEPLAVPNAVVEKSSAESQESWNSEDDPYRLWCICKQPHNNRFMICCDGCEDWFHGKCVNITKAMGQQMEEQGIEWRCPNCIKKTKGATPKSAKVSPSQKRAELLDQPGEPPLKSPGSAKNGCIVCKKAARASSIYCSDACILKHAQDSLISPPPASKSDADPVKKKSDSRVIVYERKSGRLLAGPNAPTAENLRSWLQKNPTFEVVRPGALSSIKPGTVKKKAPNSGPMKIQTTLNFERVPKKLPQEQPSTSRDQPSTSRDQQSTTRNQLGTFRSGTITSRDHPAASRDQQGTSRDQPGTSRDQPGTSRDQPGVSRNQLNKSRDLPSTSRDQPVQSRNQPSTLRDQPTTPRAQQVEGRERRMLLSRKEEVKPQTPKTPVTPRSQSILITDTPKLTTSTPKSVSEPRKLVRSTSNRSQSTHEKPSGSPSTSRRKDSAAAENKSKMQNAGEADIRENVRKSLQEQLSLRMAETKGSKFTEDDIRQFAEETELELQELFRDVGMKYKAKYRSLMFNIKDRKNLTLWQKICDKSITPKQLVRLSPEELASQELAEWRDQESKHQLELIKKSELDLLAASKTYVLKTHKGEEVMETKEATELELDPNVPVEDVVTVLNDSTVGEEVTREVALESKRKSEEKEGKKDTTSRKRERDDSSSRSKRSRRDSRRDSDRRSSRRKSDSKEQRVKSSKEQRRRSTRGADKKSRTRSSSRERKRDSKEKSDSSERRARRRSKSRHSRSVSKGRDRSRSRARARSRSRARSRRRSRSRPARDHAHRSRSQDYVKNKTDSTDSESVERPKSALKELHPEYDPHEPMITSAFSEEDLRKDSYEDTYRSDVIDTPLDYDPSKAFTLDSEIMPSTFTVPHDKTPEAESDQEPSSTVENAAATVWNGCINMVDVARFYVAAYELSGSAVDLEEDLSTELDIVGRINPDTVWEYIAKTKKTSNKDIVLLRLQAANDEEKMQYIALYSYLSSRNRLGVVKVPNTTTVKDFYIVPLGASAALPAVVQPASAALPEPRSHMLIAIVIRQRRKRPPPHQKDPLPAKVSRRRSFSPRRSLGGRALPLPSYTSPALPANVKDKIASTIGSLTEEDAGGGGGGGEERPSALRSKMDELNRQIEEQKQQILKMAQADSSVAGDDEAYSPSRPVSPAAPTLADIALPSNLHEILATIKQRETTTHEDAMRNIPLP